MFDLDKNGLIDIKELRAVMQALGESPTDSQLELLIKSVDLDGDGVISEPEFEKILKCRKKILKSEKAVAKAFAKYDVDGDGYITPKELRETMLSVGENFTDKEVQGMIDAADKDNDGRISYAEFCAMMGYI